jgi:hypothetical protein
MAVQDKAAGDRDDGEDDDFVGLLATPDGAGALRLPHGYPMPPGATEDESRLRTLGELTPLLARFADLHPFEVSAAPLSCAPRDGLLRERAGLRRRLADGAAGHSTIGGYIELMRRLRHPQLLGMQRAPGLAPFDPRHLGRSLERATYLPDGSAYFEQQWGQLRQTRRHSGSLIGLACWLARDALLHVFNGAWTGEVPAALLAEWDELAQRCDAGRPLPRHASLFNDERGDTLQQLRSAFDAGARQAPPMDAEGRELHALLDRLLNFSVADAGGDIWGMRGFHRVWEAACLEQAIEQYGIQLVFCCDDELLSGVSQKLRGQWRAARHRVFARNGTARRPDLVLRLDDGRFRIIDFKYTDCYGDDAAFFKRRPPAIDLARAPRLPGGRIVIDGAAYKAQQDVANLETYRWLLMQHELHSCDESAVDLELWVPAAQDGEKACAWQANEGGINPHGSGFDRLKVRHLSSAGVLQRYASAFKLFD